MKVGAGGTVDFRPAMQCRRAVEIETLAAPLVVGHVRQHIDPSGLQRLQAVAPVAGHRLQRPAFADRNFFQQVTENAAGLIICSQGQLRRVGVDTNAHLARRGMQGRRQAQARQNPQPNDPFHPCSHREALTSRLIDAALETCGGISCRAFWLRPCSCPGCRPVRPQAAGHAGSILPRNRAAEKV